MNILIVTNEPFPYGGAAVNVIRSYAKGFIENGSQCLVLCINGNINRKYKKELNKNDTINNNSIPYRYTTLSKFRLKYKILRFINNLWGETTYLKIIKNSHKKNKIDVIYNHLEDYHKIKNIGKFAKKNNINYIMEKSEYPLILKKNNEYSRWYVNNAYKNFDAMIVETDRLKRYFTDKINQNAKQLVVPALIDPSDFLSPLIKVISEDYIYYCGSLSRSKKDGVHILIKAFVIVHKKYPNMRLKLSGFAPKPEIDYYEKLILDLKLEKFVDLIVDIPRKKLIEYMRNAKILALAKETNEIQSGGISSKVIEYLYSGNPILITDLGEITDYLKENEVIFKCKPDDVVVFADKLIYILDNYDYAKLIGLQGKKFALDYFDYRKHTKKMLDFFYDLKRNNEH